MTNLQEKARLSQLWQMLFSCNAIIDQMASRTLFYINANGNEITVEVTGTYQKTIDVKHNGVVVLTKKAWGSSGKYSFNVKEDGVTAQYHLDLYHGGRTWRNRCKYAKYSVMRNNEYILRIV